MRPKSRLAGLALAFALVLGVSVPSASAGDFAALARLDAARASVDARDGGLDIALTLTRPVPFSVRALAGPPRLVVDFRKVAFGPVAADAFGGEGSVRGVRAGPLGAAESRLVIELARPFAVARAGMRTDTPDGSALIEIRLVPAEVAGLAAAGPVERAEAGARPEAGAGATAAAEAGGDRRLTVVLDPGHGGVDPGAVRDGHHEADITLAFARELRDALRRDGRYRVALTRTDDTFVSLEGRIAAAREAGADVFVSIHADAVPEGIARGAQVYTLSREASSRAAALLAERHARDDLLAGADLSGHDDEVVRVLMDMARTETEPRTEALADALTGAMAEGGIRLHARPRESAAFAVLKAPDIPSVLVEIGFMSTPAELDKLLSAAWRRRAAAALAAGLGAWAEADAARAPLVRR